MKKKLPIRKFTISEKNGSWVTAIAITETPAIESDFITFSNTSAIKFSENKERKELLGIAMKANQHIYRVSPEGEEYYCYFDAPTIREISQIFFKKGLANNLNIEHTDLDAQAYVFQSFIIDSAKGITSPAGLNANDGDWIIGVKCESEEIFNILKSNSAGFSVEGIFQMLDEEFTAQTSEVEQVLKDFYKALKSLK